MSAQPTTATAPVLQGETSGPNYGAADMQQAAQAALPGQETGTGRGDHQLLNGVDPQRTAGAREEPPRAGPRVPEQSQEGRARALTNGMETNDRTEQTSTLRTTSQGILAQGDVVSPERSSDYLSISPSSPRRERIAPGHAEPQPHQAARTVAME